MMTIGNSIDIFGDSFSCVHVVNLILNLMLLISRILESEYKFIIKISLYMVLVINGALKNLWD